MDAGAAIIDLRVIRCRQVGRENESTLVGIVQIFQAEPVRWSALYVGQQMDEEGSLTIRAGVDVDLAKVTPKRRIMLELVVYAVRRQGALFEVVRRLRSLLGPLHQEDGW